MTDRIVSLSFLKSGCSNACFKACNQHQHPQHTFQSKLPKHSQSVYVQLLREAAYSASNSLTFSLFAELSMCWMMDWKCLSLSWKRRSSEIAESAQRRLSKRTAQRGYSPSRARISLFCCTRNCRVGSAIQKA